MPITFYDPYQAQRQQQAQFQDFVQSLMTSFVLNRMQENLQAKRMENQEKQKIQELQTQAQLDGWQIADENRQVKEGEEPPPRIKIGDLSLERTKRASATTVSLGGVPGYMQPDGTWHPMHPQAAPSYERIDTEQGAVFVNKQNPNNAIQTPYKSKKEYAPGAGKQLVPYYNTDTGEIVQKSFNIEQGGTVPANLIPASDTRQVSYHRHLKSMGLKPSDLPYPEYQQMLDPKQSGERGQLSESAALENLGALNHYDSEKLAAATERFYQLRKGTPDGKPGLRPGEALVAVTREMQRKEQEAEIAKQLLVLSKKYGNPNAIRKAVRSGELDTDMAVKLLQTYHGYE